MGEAALVLLELLLHQHLMINDSDFSSSQVSRSAFLSSVALRLSPRGRGSCRRHGDGPYGASQLPCGTINKHQSLVNISAAARGCTAERWRKTTGEQTGCEEDRRGDDQMKGEKRQKGGGSEKTQARVCPTSRGPSLERVSTSVCGLTMIT